MARTQVKGTQLEDGSVGRPDLNTTVAGQAVIRKIIPGTGLSISSTGVDEGTGDVTLNVIPEAVVNLAPVKVRTSAAQNIAATTLTKLVFGTVEHAPTAEAWVAATNRYVVQSNGLYTVRGSVRTTGTARGLRLMLYKNGSLLHSLSDAATVSANFPFSHGSTDLQLVDGDYLELWLYASASTVVASSADCQFCVRRVL